MHPIVTHAAIISPPDRAECCVLVWVYPDGQLHIGDLMWDVQDMNKYFLPRTKEWFECTR
jgi:hypothetical protein